MVAHADANFIQRKVYGQNRPVLTPTQQFCTGRYIRIACKFGQQLVQQLNQQLRRESFGHYQCQNSVPQKELQS